VFFPFFFRREGIVSLPLFFPRSVSPQYGRTVLVFGTRRLLFSPSYEAFFLNVEGDSSPSPLLFLNPLGESPPERKASPSFPQPLFLSLLLIRYRERESFFLFLSPGSLFLIRSLASGSVTFPPLFFPFFESTAEEREELSDPFFSLLPLG